MTRFNEKYQVNDSTQMWQASRRRQLISGTLSWYQDTNLHWAYLSIHMKVLRSIFPVLFIVFTYRWPWLPSSSLPASDPASSAWTAPTWSQCEGPTPCAEGRPELSQSLGPRREACTKRLFLPRAPEVSVSTTGQLADGFNIKKHDANVIKMYQNFLLVYYPG